MASQLNSELFGNLWGILGENRPPSSARAHSVDVSVALHYGTSQSSKSNSYCAFFLFRQDLAQAFTSLNKPKLKCWRLFRNQAKLKYGLTGFFFPYFFLTRVSVLVLP
jgi:hypothetical protein